MITQSTIVILVMIGLGAHALYTGLRYRLGYYKSPYFGHGRFHFYTEMGMSLGFLFLLLSVSTLLNRLITFDETQTMIVSLFSYLGIALLGINWFLGVINSPLLKPGWVRWLEAAYDEAAIQRAREAARRMGLKKWEDQIKTEADLAQWMAAVGQESVLDANGRFSPP